MFEQLGGGRSILAIFPLESPLGTKRNGRDRRRHRGPIPTTTGAEGETVTMIAVQIQKQAIKSAARFFFDEELDANCLRRPRYRRDFVGCLWTGGGIAHAREHGRIGTHPAKNRLAPLKFRECGE